MILDSIDSYEGIHIGDIVKIIRFKEDSIYRDGKKVIGEFGKVIEINKSCGSGYYYSIRYFNFKFNKGHRIFYKGEVELVPEREALAWMI